MDRLSVKSVEVKMFLSKLEWWLIEHGVESVIMKIIYKEGCVSGLNDWPAKSATAKSGSLVQIQYPLLNFMYYERKNIFLWEIL